MEQHRTPWLLVSAGPAILLAAPWVAFNPDLARSPLEWAELLLGLALAASGLALVLGLAARGREGRLSRASPWVLLLCTAATALGVGYVVAGWIGLAGAGAAAVAVVVLWRLRRPDPAHRVLQLILALVLLAVSLTAVAYLGRAPRIDRQVVFIGLDGATWTIVDRLREQGRLPVFDGLVERGTRAEIDTVFPVISPPVWTSIATGVTPARHGVKDFYANSTDVQRKRFWEVADESGLTSGVFGYLVTWPPEKDGGFLVPGWMAQDARTIPPELGFVKELEQAEKSRAAYGLADASRLGFGALRHGLTLGTINSTLVYYWRRATGRSGPFEGAYSGRALKLELTVDVFCHLLRRVGPELGVYYYSSIDAVEHQFFKYYEPEHFPDVTPEEVAALGDVIPRLYEATDRAIARILDAAHPQASVVIASDHGQRAATESGKRWYVIKSGALLEALDLRSELRATNVGRSVFLRGASRDLDTLGPALERIATDVTTLDGTPLFRLERADADEALLSVREGFDHDAHAEILVGGSAVAIEELIENTPTTSGEHTETALLLMAGPRIAHGRTLPGGSVLDIAPTLLHLLGLPVARDLEGRVLVEAFENSEQEAATISFVDSYGDPVRAAGDGDHDELNEDTLDKLKALGYVQ